MLTVDQFLNRRGVARFQPPAPADDIETDLLVDEPAAATPAPEREQSLLQAAEYALRVLADPSDESLSRLDAETGLELAIEAAKATGDTSAIAADYHAARQALPEAKAIEVSRNESFGAGPLLLQETRGSVAYFVRCDYGGQILMGHGTTLSKALADTRAKINKLVADAETILAAQEPKHDEDPERWDGQA